MPDGLMARLWAGLLATSPLEALAVLSSLVYVVLAVPRSRWCWVAGGVGSLIYVWLFARARLPMQSLLQVWYLGVAVFGFLRWSREGMTRISLLSWRGHVAGICRIAAAGCGHRAFPGRGNAGSLAKPGCVNHGAEPLRHLAHGPWQA
jgi:nicotinamide riboside transporter PnuC